MSGPHSRTAHAAMRAARMLLVVGTIAAHATFLSAQGTSNGTIDLSIFSSKRNK